MISLGCYMERHIEPSKSSETRISMRSDPEKKAVIAKAADIMHTSITNFILDHAYDAAKQIIADETNIKLKKEQFDHLFEMIDNTPSENIARMRKLLSSKSRLDD